MDAMTRYENELMREIDELREDYDAYTDDLQPRSHYGCPLDSANFARVARLEQRVQQLERWQRELIQPAFETRPRTFPRD